MSDGLPDELFELRNFFYLGAFQKALQEAATVTATTEALKIEKEVFVYRSHIGLGNHKTVLAEVKDSAPTALQSVKLLATYLASEDNKEIALMTVKEWLSDPISQNNPTLQVVAGTIFTHERNYEEALRALHQGTTLEMQYMSIQTLIRIDRIDVAEKQLRAMQQAEDDATLTQLATAFVGMAQGGSKVQESFTILQDLSERYASSAMLLNGMAVCQMTLGKFEEAEKLLLDAITKDGNSAEAMMNLVAVFHHNRRSQEAIAKYVTALREKHPNSEWSMQYTALEKGFDRFAEKYS
eukprot:tig00000388_g24824.t1